MELFRITRAEYQNDLSGIGAYHHGGRWNSPRGAMLYASSRRSLAMLEILVHGQRPTPPPDYVVVVLYVPDAIARPFVGYFKNLGPGRHFKHIASRRDWHCGIIDRKIVKN